MEKITVNWLDLSRTLDFDIEKVINFFLNYFK